LRAGFPLELLAPPESRLTKETALRDQPESGRSIGLDAGR